MISYNVIICRKAAKNAERIRISRQEPHVLTKGTRLFIFLKTIFPSRKYTKMYLRKDEK
jgi:hypothetical protein